VQQVEDRILGMPEIEFLYAKTGSNDQAAEDQIGTLTLNYIEWNKRRKADDILEEIRAKTSDLVGIKIETRKPDSGPPIGKPIRIEFSSRFPDARLHGGQ
jgi:multidrug efflux pump